MARYALTRPPVSNEEITLTVRSGQNTAQIADELVKKGIVSNAYTFRIYAVLTQTESRLQLGKHKLKASMSYREILNELVEGRKTPVVKAVVPEGFTVTEIGELLAEKTERPPVDFYEYMRGQGVDKVRPDQLPADLDTVEGYLFPKTYAFHKDEHPKKIVSRLVEQFELETTNIDWAYAQQENLSVHQIMTVASLVEKEAKVPDERPIMAAVIYNRLAQGMPLQIDATVQYALPQRKEALSENDLTIASPYNTYQHTGLPPGPIASPGIDSIKAALAPAQVDFLYYVLTSPDGSHTFTKSYDEFLRAKREAGQAN